MQSYLLIPIIQNWHYFIGRIRQETSAQFQNEDFVTQKIFSKMHLTTYGNIHDGVTDFELDSGKKIKQMKK